LKTFEINGVDLVNRALGKRVFEVIEAKDFVKVVDNGESLWLKVLNRSQADKAELNADKDNHDRDDSLEKEYRSKN
jgi:hypothetical protein